MRPRHLLGLGLSCVALAAPPPLPPPCSIDLPGTGEHVSLAGLKRPSGSDYVAHLPNSSSDSTSGDTVYLNVCRSVLKETWGVDEPAKVGVYREREKEKGESMGSWNETLFAVDGQVGMLMGEGSQCPGTSRRMSTLISFQCAHDVWGPGEPHFAGTPDGCAFFFVWRTQLACPASGRRGFFHSLFAVFWGALVVFAFYVVLFFAYARFAKGLRGTDQFPSLRGSGAAVGHVKDGLTVAAIWVMDRVSELAKVVMGRDREGNSGWTPASGRAWWEQHPGYHRQHSRRSADVPRTDPEPAFTLGEEEEAGQRAKGNGGGPEVNVVPPTPTSGTPQREGPAPVTSLVDT